MFFPIKRLKQARRTRLLINLDIKTPYFFITFLSIFFILIQKLFFFKHFKMMIDNKIKKEKNNSEKINRIVNPCSKKDFRTMLVQIFFRTWNPASVDFYNHFNNFSFNSFIWITKNQIIKKYSTVVNLKINF